MATWTVRIKDDQLPSLAAVVVVAEWWQLEGGAWQAMERGDPPDMVAAFNAEQVVSIVRREPVSGELSVASARDRERAARAVVDAIQVALGQKLSPY